MVEKTSEEIKFTNMRNPILPLEYHIPDSEGHVMPDGKLYIYGSYDDRNDVYCSEKYRVVSTTDMKNWILHGESLNGKTIPWFNNPDAPKYPGIDWAHPTPFIKKMLEEEAKKGNNMKEAFEKESEASKPPLLFAPDCIEKNGKYYLYFCMQDDSEGVAVSDSPEGPFSNPVQLPCGGIDPAVFIDEDGQAYYYWGQLFSHGVKLKEDMVSFDRNDIKDDLVTEEEHFFHEGSSMRKIGDTYYYVYADMERGKPTSLGYSTGESPLGPFQYRGIIIDNDGCDPETWNNHGSIECVNGQWYVFYHRCSRGAKLYRRLCIEPIKINKDGSIDEVKMTSQGVGEPFAPGEKIMGYQACQLKGTVYIGLKENAEAENGCMEKLMHISDEDEAVFRYVKSEKNWTKIEVTGKGTGEIEVCMNGKLAGIVTMDGAEEQLSLYSGRLNMEAGEYEVSLKFKHPENMEIVEVTLI